MWLDPAQSSNSSDRHTKKDDAEPAANEWLWALVPWDNGLLVVNKKTSEGGQRLVARDLGQR